LTADTGVAEERHGRVLSLVLSNPESRNALRPQASRAMAKALRLASEDAALGAVVLSGAGEHFCAGGDLRALGESRRDKPRQHLYERIENLNEFVRSIRQCRKPVIAAVEGHAAGAGCVLALACDLIVAAESAQFTMAYVKAGLNPDGAGTWFLSRAVPRQLAAEMALTGVAVGAKRLAELGAVNRIAPKGRALAEALDWGAKLAEGPLRAQARIKRLLNAAPRNDYLQQLELERSLMVEALHGEEAGEGIAAFLEKRPPRFTLQRAGRSRRKRATNVWRSAWRQKYRSA
jgi:enoyl-CoA hydratase/carnithine racemase